MRNKWSVQWKLALHLPESPVTYCGIQSATPQPTSRTTEVTWYLDRSVFYNQLKRCSCKVQKSDIKCLVRWVRLYFPEYLHSIFNTILQTNTQKSVVQHRNQTTADMFSPSIHLKRWNHPEFHMKVWECFHFLDRLALAAGRSCDRLAGGFPAWRLWSISSIRQTSLQSLLLKARADIQSHIQCGQRAVSGECFTLSL